MSYLLCVLYYIYTQVACLCSKLCFSLSLSLSLPPHPKDLLQLQYEGLAIMKMFERAKINVNLLIYLINKKFHGGVQ